MSDDITAKIVTRVADIINNMYSAVVGDGGTYHASVSELYTIRFASIARPEVACSIYVGECVDTIAALMILLDFTMKLLVFCRDSKTHINDGQLLRKQNKWLTQIDSDVASWKQTKICS